MKMMKMSMLFLISALAAHAHEGHDHGPSNLQAPKGGVLRSLETVHLELKAEGAKIEIYPYEKDAKTEKLVAAQASKYPVSATVTLPKKKPQALELSPKGDHWEASFDAKGAHRYALELSITQGGHKDKVKYTVEPKK